MRERYEKIYDDFFIGFKSDTRMSAKLDFISVEKKDQEDHKVNTIMLQL